VYKCWRGGDVHGCGERGGGQKQEQFAGDLKDGERIQHGALKVLANNTFIFYKGLSHYPEDTGNESVKIARCKLACYTTVACSVWQYNKDGCYIEDRDGPLTSENKAEVEVETEAAKTMNNGQTIEHYCPFYVPPEPEEGLPWVWIITGIVLGLLALAAIIYSLQKTPKVKKTRDVKITPKEEPEEEVPLTTVYFIPQPTMLVQQPMVAPYAPVPTGPVYSMPMGPAVEYAMPTGPAYSAVPTGMPAMV